MKTLAKNRVAYVSGAMTGHKDGQRGLFELWSKKLRAKGWRVINPHDLDAHRPEDMAYEKRLAGDLVAYLIAFLHGDDVTIAVLPGWEKSNGARLEVKTALDLGIKVRKVEEML